MKAKLHRLCKFTVMLGGLLPLFSGASLAQVGGPADYDLKLIPEKKILRQGEEIGLDSTVAVRKLGVLGWSYGVEHDEALLDVLSVTTVGSDVPSVFFEGFNQTRLITENSVNVGWIQAVVLSLSAEKRELPIHPRFVLAKARYKARTGVCGAQSEVPTSIVYSDKLAVQGSPPVEINLTVEAESVNPSVKDPADLTLECPAPGALDLKLLAQPEVEGKLVANRTDILGIKVMLQNNTQGGEGPVQVQGWSYGLKLNPLILEVVDMVLGPDAAALNGGAGPDFKAYNFRPLDQSADGTIKGVSVGVVISLDPPNQELGVPAAQSRNLEVLRVKSAITLAAGQPDVSTELQFVSEVLGGSRPIESIITVGGLSVTPKSDTPSLTLALTPAGVPGPFKRGHANPDGRLDIADGIWTIRVLFYQQGTFSCQDAADTNDDGRIDLADALYTFNYLLRAGPRPPGLTATCGADATADNLTCLQTSTGCN